MEQLAMDFNPPSRLLPTLADPSVHPDDEAALKASCVAMLDRLREGPATNRELEMYGAGERIAARRHDLNEWFAKRGMPFFIPRGKRMRGQRGITCYWLEEVK